MINSAIREIGYWLKRSIFLIPPFQLLLSFILSFLTIDGYDFVKWGNSSGYSILTSFVYVTLFVFIGRYCLFTKISAITLFLIAVFNYVTAFFVTAENYKDYEDAYARIMTVVAVAMWIVFSNTRNNKNKKPCGANS